MRVKITPREKGETRRGERKTRLSLRLVIARLAMTFPAAALYLSLKYYEIFFVWSWHLLERPAIYLLNILGIEDIRNSVSLWVKITRKPSSIGRPFWCFAAKQSSNSVTGCDVINRWIIGIRNFAKSCPPPPPLFGS